MRARPAGRPCRRARGSRPRAAPACRSPSSGRAASRRGRRRRRLRRRARPGRRARPARRARRPAGRATAAARCRRPRRAAPARPCAASPRRAAGDPRRRAAGRSPRPRGRFARSVMPARSSRPPGGWRASSRAPADSAVVPSTEANTSEVCVTLPTSVRASSTSAPVPEPLSFAPGPGGRSSRPAMKTSASRERPLPLTTPSTLIMGTVRPLASGARKRCSVTFAPAARRRSATQSAAEMPPVLPGERSEKRSASSFVAASAWAPSNVGGSELRGRAGAVRAPTSSTKAGMSTTSQPVRYGPGRSSAAARGARAALRRTLARRDRRSRGAPSGNIGFEYARRLAPAPPPCRARGNEHLHCGR